MLLHYLDDLDSKMECMRRLIEADQQVAGNFTGYSPSLERVLLKKEKYLGAPPAVARAVAASAPARPAAPPALPPKISSAFGDKLLQALRPGDRKEG
jgi:hypothetical protein